MNLRTAARAPRRDLPQIMTSKDQIGTPAVNTAVPACDVVSGTYYLCSVGDGYVMVEQYVRHRAAIGVIWI